MTASPQERAAKVIREGKRALTYEERLEILQPQIGAVTSVRQAQALGAALLGRPLSGLAAKRRKEAHRLLRFQGLHPPKGVRNSIVLR